MVAITQGTSSEASRTRVLRHSGRDAWLVGLALVHGLLLWAVPSIPLIAIGLWWNANTVGHNFVHLPFFRSPRLNRVFSGYLSALTGIPQILWRDRHLAHHRDAAWRLRWSRQLGIESAIVLGTWCAIFAASPQFFWSVYVPGYLVGLGLCYLQGHYEHARGTTSHYGWLYNVLFFNDGFHVEHHGRPGEHWTRLSSHRVQQTPSSRWPAVLRWMDVINLEAMERLVLRSRWLQRFVLKTHERAWKKLLPLVREHGRIAIVGGGLFPRTALVLKDLLPESRLTIVDCVPEHINTAKQWLNGRAHYELAFFEPSNPPASVRASALLVIPLSFKGARRRVYENPTAPAVVVHDWIWRRRGTSVIVSWLLLKRLNLVCT